ncbi:AraC family transcriptional regulator [Aestuariispira ectoiniformans]|uniref:AraC family transcriptional regulator n=1 Tax=Aestuariispira ectoiniformans TaxID=2775080 RepID=UPI00223AC0C7|nr:DJ-1/PfpI family protein [Aestuariispira ectoiniformans]
MMTQKSALSVGLVPLHRFTLAPFASFLDVLRLAADKGDRSEQRNCNWTVTAPGASMVTSSSGVRIATDRQPPDPRQFDYIAVFGGLLDVGTEITPEMHDYLRRADDMGIPLIGVCTGSYALMSAGLMKERRCCVNWFHHRDYLKLCDDEMLETGQLFLEDSDRITCAGGAGAADLALWLVDRHLGKRWTRASMNSSATCVWDSPAT